MIIQTTNNLHLSAPKTYTSYSEVSGTNVLRWKNPSGFNASWAIQVGETGEEQTEIVLLNTATPSGTAGTLTANTLYAHSADTPLYGIKYNQIIFERSTAGTAGTAAPMTDGTITVQADRIVTEFDDTSGSASYAYRTYLRNSVLNATTEESNWITSSGFTYYSMASIRNRIRSKLWNSAFITDSAIDYWINEWLEKMRNAAISVNQDYALGSTSVAFGTAGMGTITASDFRGQIRRVWITYDGVSDYQATKTTIREFLPDQEFSSSHPYVYMYGENVFGVKPGDTGGTAAVIYPLLFTPLDDDTDELPISIKPYSKSFVDYGLAQALYKDQKPNEASKKEQDADVELERFKTEIAPRAKTGPTMIALVEPLTGITDGLVI